MHISILKTALILPRRFYSIQILYSYHPTHMQPTIDTTNFTSTQPFSTFGVRTAPFGTRDQFLDTPEQPRPQTPAEIERERLATAYDPNLDDDCIDEPNFTYAPLPDRELVDLEFLSHFVGGSAFYVEILEEEVGEALDDFWMARERAHRIVSDLIIRRLREVA